MKNSIFILIIKSHLGRLIIGLRMSHQYANSIVLFFKYISIGILLVCSSYAKSSYNAYPVIFVVGRSNVSSDWNTIMNGIRNLAPGIKITAYDVNDSTNECVEDWGREIGDREYCRNNQCKMGKTWLEKAHDEYGEFEKVNMVGFSTGGIACREYVSQSYYQNDIDRIVTIDSPNMAAPTEVFANLIEKSDTFGVVGGVCVDLGIAAGFPFTALGIYLSTSGITFMTVRSVIETKIKPHFQGNPRTCLMQQLDIGASFMKNLHSRKYPENIQLHFIGLEGEDTLGLDSADAIQGMVGKFNIGTTLEWLVGIPNCIFFMARTTKGDSVFTSKSQMGAGENPFLEIDENGGVSTLPPSYIHTEQLEDLGSDCEHDLNDPTGRKSLAILKGLEWNGPILKGNSVSFPTDGWIVGFSKDKQIAYIEGDVSDYLPQHVKVAAYVDGIKTTETTLDMTTITTDPGGRTGNAKFKMNVPLPHGGAHNIKIVAENAGGLTDSDEFTYYVCGTQFPHDGTHTLGITSFDWNAKNGSEIVSQGFGEQISFIGTSQGEVPSKNMRAPPGARLSAFYPDGSINSDIVFYDPATGQNNITTVPASGDFVARLNPLFEGKSYRL